MYLIQDISEIESIPSNINKCVIKQNNLLKFVYENRNDASCKFDVEFLRRKLVKSIRNSYINKEEQDVVFTKNDIKKILKENNPAKY